MEDQFIKILFETHQDSPKGPTIEQVADFTNRLLGILFPDLTNKIYDNQKELSFDLLNLKSELYEMLFMYPNRESINADNKTNLFFDKLKTVYQLLKTDVSAMFEGDPAAISEKEIVRSYPGFYAVASYRLAHELYLLNIKVIPRMIAEIAHSRTGVDIHPGAKIGKGFCIDHGTGVVIGETADIGDYVKIYQGVTLGALSVAKELAQTKRHPTIEDYVVLYSGATVLGGNTTIGHHSIIGGNTWITRSVDPESKIYYQSNQNR